MSGSLATVQGLVAIRPAGLDDAAQLYELRLEALAGHPQVFAADYALTAAGGVEAWRERMANNICKETGVICTAAVGERLVGMVGIAIDHWPKTCHAAVIWGAYVQAEWRGLHLAEALIEECIAWGRTHGVTIVKLGVVTANVAAIRCYTRCGFTVYGIDPMVIRYDGALYDELLMSRAV